MPPVDLIRLFMQQSQAQGSRSTVMNPLGWLVATLVGGLVASQAVHAAGWVGVLLGVAFGGACAVYLTAYVYFALRQPDHLRSERYSLTKMVIERGHAGDTASGYIDKASVPQLPLTDDPVTKPVEDHE